MPPSPPFPPPPTGGNAPPTRNTSSSSPDQVTQFANPVANGAPVVVQAQAADLSRPSTHVDYRTKFPPKGRADEIFG